MHITLTEPLASNLRRAADERVVGVRLLVTRLLEEGLANLIPADEFLTGKKKPPVYRDAPERTPITVKWWCPKTHKACELNCPTVDGGTGECKIAHGVSCRNCGAAIVLGENGEWQHTEEPDEATKCWAGELPATP